MRMLLLALLVAHIVDGEWIVHSPTSNLSVKFETAGDGGILYSIIARAGDVILAPSKLAVELEHADFGRSVDCEVEVSPHLAFSEYELLHGKGFRYHANYFLATVRCHVKGNVDRKATALVRAYDEGVAFQWEFSDDKTGRRLAVTSERTEFNFPLSFDGVASRAVVSRYELARGSPGPAQPYEDVALEQLDTSSAYSIPTLVNVGRYWMLIGESGMDGIYHGSHLDARAKEGAVSLELAGPLAMDLFGGTQAVPMAKQLSTPWRIVVVGDSLQGIVESNLIHHPHLPSQVPAVQEWLKLGRAAVTWWPARAQPRTYAEYKECVDVAAEMGWEYCVVDADWDAIPGESLQGLVYYGMSKKVTIFVWYRAAKNLFAMMEDATRRQEQRLVNGTEVRGIIVDLPFSDNPRMIDHAIDLLRGAELVQQAVVWNGFATPRGYEKRWPHLLGFGAPVDVLAYPTPQDADLDVARQHVMLAFTRSTMAGMTRVSTVHGTQRLTTPAHEVALAVLFEAGFIMLSEPAQFYRDMPGEARQLLRTLPVRWDETRHVAGVVGQIAVVARRSGERWLMAGISARAKATVEELSTAFLAEGAEYSLRILHDSTSGPLAASRFRISPTVRTLRVAMAPRGGFLAEFGPSRNEDPSGILALPDFVQQATAARTYGQPWPGGPEIAVVATPRPFSQQGIAFSVALAGVVVLGCIQFLRSRMRRKRPGIRRTS